MKNDDFKIVKIKLAKNNNMKTLQKILVILLCGTFLFSEGQDNARKGWDGVVKGGPRLNVSYNSTTPSSATKDVYVINSSGISGDLFVPFQLFRKGWDGTVKGGSFGLNIGGTYNFGGNGYPTTALPEGFLIGGQTASSVAYKGVDPKNPGFRIGGGPQANFNIGEHFTISPMVLAEYFSMTQKDLSAVQTSEVNGKTKEYNLWTLPETKTTGLAITAKLRLRYMFTPSLGIFADGSYILGPKINTQVSRLVPVGNPNQAGQYEQQQLDMGKMAVGETKSTSYNALAFNVGLSFDFGRIRCPNGDCANVKKSDDKGWNGLSKNDDKGWNGKSDQKTNVTKEVLNNGQDIFTVTHLKKESSEKPNCVQILSPSNGSNQNVDNLIKILLNNESTAKSGNVDIKIYKISNDKDYFNKKENEKELLNIQNTTMVSTRFENQSKETGFTPISVSAKQSGGVIESAVSKGQLSQGTYKMVVITSCGVQTSNFRVSSSALKTILLVIDCKQKFGDYSYTFKVQNTGTNPINITSIPVFLSSTGTVSSFSILPMLPTVIGPGATQTFTGNFSYSGSYPGVVYASVSGYQVGNPNLTSQDTEMGELKSCICDFCNRTAEYDSEQTPNATYSATGNSLSIHQVWWDMNPATAAMIVGAKAEIISFSREVSDDCMKCDKNSDQWGNFISGTSGAANGSFGNATGSVTGNTHHTLYFANPNKYFFDLNISLPPISTLTCCCEKFKIKIRYTYTYKDKDGSCKMCSEVFEYSYQKGQCPVIHPSGGGIDIKDISTKASNIKN